MHYRRTLKFKLQQLFLCPKLIERVAFYQHLQRAAEKFLASTGAKNLGITYFEMFGGPYEVNAETRHNKSVAENYFFGDFAFIGGNVFRQAAGMENVYHTKEFDMCRRCNKYALSEADLWAIVSKATSLQLCTLKLAFSPNTAHKQARWILDKKILVYPDGYTYNVVYGHYSDFKEKMRGVSHSAWDISLKSDKNECFEDFLIRISKIDLQSPAAANIGWNNLRIKTPSRIPVKKSDKSFVKSLRRK